MYILAPTLLFFISFLSAILSIEIISPEHYYYFYSFGIAHVVVGTLTSYKQWPRRNSALSAWVLIGVMTPMCVYLVLSSRWDLAMVVIGAHHLMSETFFKRNLGEAEHPKDVLLSSVRFVFSCSVYFFIARKSFHFPAWISSNLFSFVCISWIIAVLVYVQLYWKDNRPTALRWILHHSFIFAVAIRFYQQNNDRHDQQFFLLYHNYFWLFFPLFVNKPRIEKLKYFFLSASAQLALSVFAVVVLTPFAAPGSTGSIGQMMSILMVQFSVAHVMLSVLLSKANPEFISVYWNHLRRV